MMDKPSCILEQTDVYEECKENLTEAYYCLKQGLSHLDSTEELISEELDTIYKTVELMMQSLSRFL